jgi:gluconate 2-dehydrogenase gamma chain
MDKESDSDPTVGAVLGRRELLSGTATLLLGVPAAHAGTIFGELPWWPNAGDPPTAVGPGPWWCFNSAEGAAIEALADRIIPPDPQTPGGKDAGCAIFLDRQLAGPYGRQEGLYVREALAALDRACQSRQGGKSFAELSTDAQDAVLAGLESGEFKLDGVDGQAFFDQAIKDLQMGFFADPIYGGNRDMVAWKMIGYPGARYNYLDWVKRHNERFPLPPVSITGRAEWTPKS